MKNIQPPAPTSSPQARRHYSPITTLHPERSSPAKRPEWHYIPAHSRRKEPGMSETLLGCGTLLIIGILVLTLLYYLSLAR